MHASILDFLKRNLNVSETAGKTVLEVGSYDVNGSPRTVVMPLNPGSYVGLDGAPGPGVDVVGDAGELVSKFGRERFDIVISTEMLEHLREWKPAITEMKRVLKPGGILFVTTRSPGFMYHAYPVDKWRYTTEDFRAIFGDMEILRLADDPVAPGVFLKARKPAEFTEQDLGAIQVRTSPERIRGPLLMTATINPGPTPFLMVRDPRERLRDYVASLMSWVCHGPFQAIVICENSGAGGMLERLCPWADAHETSLEVLSFTGNAACREKGKGHGEGEIIGYALTNSRLLKDATTFHKVTGRLYVENAFRFVDMSRESENVFSVGTHGGRPHVDTRFFKAGRRFYREHLETAHLSVDDHRNHFYLENAYAAVLSGMVGSSVRQMPVTPAFIGRDGTNGQWHKQFYPDILREAAVMTEKLGMGPP